MTSESKNLLTFFTEAFLIRALKGYQKFRPNFANIRLEPMVYQTEAKYGTFLLLAVNICS